MGHAMWESVGKDVSIGGKPREAVARHLWDTGTLWACPRHVVWDGGESGEGVKVGGVFCEISRLGSEMVTEDLHSRNGQLPVQHDYSSVQILNFSRC